MKKLFRLIKKMRKKSKNLILKLLIKVFQLKYKKKTKNIKDFLRKSNINYLLLLSLKFLNCMAKLLKS